MDRSGNLKRFSAVLPDSGASLKAAKVGKKVSIL